MTDIERLVLNSHSAQLQLLMAIAHAVNAYHDGVAQAVLDQIEATLDSVTADEADGEK